jgi:large subunit ribosomal protein L6
MSRIGKAPIAIPAGVDVKITGTHVSVKGPKGQLAEDIDSDMKLSIDDGVLTVARPTGIALCTVLVAL